MGHVNKGKVSKWACIVKWESVVLCVLLAWSTKCWACSLEKSSHENKLRNIFLSFNVDGLLSCRSQSPWRLTGILAWLINKFQPVTSQKCRMGHCWSTSWTKLQWITNKALSTGTTARTTAAWDTPSLQWMAPNRILLRVLTGFFLTSKLEELFHAEWAPMCL